MGAERSLMWGVSLVLMLFVVVSVIDYVVILHTKLDFDFYCRQVFWQCEQNVGLSSEERLKVELELKEKGFVSVSVVAPEMGSVSKGQVVKLSVKANKKLVQRKKLYLFERVEMPFLYEQEVISRRLVN